MPSGVTIAGQQSLCALLTTWWLVTGLGALPAPSPSLRTTVAEEETFFDTTIDRD